MGRRDDDTARAAELRRRAEEAARRTPVLLSECSEPRSPEVERSLHELRVHQLQLEMQNEQFREVQVELEAERQRYFDLYDLAPVGYCTLSAAGLVLEANRTAAEMLGFTHDGLTGIPFIDLVFTPDQGLFQPLRAQFQESREPFACDLRLARGDGAPFWAHLAVKAAAQLETGPSSRIVLIDITARKQVEEEKARLEGQLRHVERLEAIGLLAGGMAHDFNNLLGAMAGNVDLLRMDLDPKGPATAHLGALDKLVERASNLVARILSFAGKARLQVQTLDLNRQVEAMTGLLRSCLAGQTGLRWEPAAGLPSMQGDSSQVQQVIMSLVLNAAEAMGARGGSITLRTGVETLAAEDLEGRYRGQDLQPGRHLTLEVSDSGPGIAPEVRERIFDPFFTTRLAGRGLGLSVALSVLRSHRGAIRVDSEEGRGTTVKLLFPAGADEAWPAQEERPAEGALVPAYRGSGRILVVDDEDALREVAAVALRRMGFEPLEARDGLEALRAFEANRDTIRLVLLDLTMPRMDGEEAYRVLRRAGAAMPIILASGFGPVDALQAFRGRGVAGFLTKPYRFRELAEAVQAALARGSALPEASASPPGERVPWQREFETGHPALDAQHQGLIRVFNALAAAAAKGGQGEVDLALARLAETYMAHFGLEEGLMCATAYPGAREHQAVHAQLVGQVQGLLRRVRQDRAVLTAALLDFIQDWIVCHIQAEDMQLGKHLKMAGH